MITIRCERCTDPCLSSGDPCNSRMNNKNQCVSLDEGGNTIGRRLMSHDASSSFGASAQELRVCGTFACSCEGEYWKLSGNRQACDPVCANECSTKDPCLMVCDYFFVDPLSVVHNLEYLMSEIANRECWKLLSFLCVKRPQRMWLSHV